MATTQKIPALKDKAAIFGKAIKVSNMRERDEEGDEGGDAGAFVPGREVLLTKMVIGRKHGARLIGNDLVYDAIFDRSKKPVEPDSSLCIGALRITSKFKGCTATIRFGVSNKEIEVTNARIKNIWLKPVTGGVFEMRCSVQGIMPRKLDVLDLEEQIGKEVTVSLKFGDLDEADVTDSPQADLVDGLQREEAAAEEESDAPKRATRGGNGRPGAAH